MLGDWLTRRAGRGAGAGLNNGAASWQRVMPLLAPYVRTAAYDRAGLGGSAPAPGLVTIDRQTDDLASVITGLAAGPCVLAGHSWGGLLVQLLAFRRPDLAAPHQDSVAASIDLHRKLAALLRALDVPAGETLDDQPQAEEGLVIET